MIESVIKDGKGEKYFAQVTKDRELVVIQSPYPPLAPQKVKPFRQYFTLDGTKDGDNDMGIDGSVTPVDFYIPSVKDQDRYITNLSILVGYGTSGQPYEWADGVPLTNGIRLFYISDQGEVDIHESIKTNQDMFRLNFDMILNNWQINGVNANNDFGYLLNLDLTEMVPDYGIKLDRGTSQKLVVRIQDNVGLAADSFNIIAVGFDRFE